MVKASLYGDRLRPIKKNKYFRKMWLLQKLRWDLEMSMKENREGPDRERTETFCAAGWITYGSVVTEDYSIFCDFLCVEARLSLLGASLILKVGRVALLSWPSVQNWLATNKNTYYYHWLPVTYSCHLHFLITKPKTLNFADNIAWHLP